VIEHRFDALLESAMQTEAEFEDIARRFGAAGYRVEAALMAVPAGPAGSAPRAAGPPLLAGFAPRLAGRLGQVARSIAAADRAGPEAGRVGDQAMRAQRPAVLVTDSDLLDSSAPCARLETGPGDAIAARPLPIDPKWFYSVHKPARQRDRPGCGAPSGRQPKSSGSAVSVPIWRPRKVISARMASHFKELCPVYTQSGSR